MRKLKSKKAQVRWWIYALLAIVVLAVVLIVLFGPGAEWLASINLFGGR